MSRRFPPVLSRLLGAALWFAGAWATPAAGQTSDPADGLFAQPNLSGGWGGLRADLGDGGFALGATETSDVFGTGLGSVTYNGRLDVDLDVDLEKIIGVRDAVLHVNAYQIRGRGPSARYLGGNLLTVSNVESTHALRLFDVWMQKGFFDSALSVRVGQIAADDEFITSQYAAALINASFGWPAIMGSNLPSGGPAYPMATPGLRIKDALTDAFAIQAALFTGDPAGTADPNVGNPSGTAFRLGPDFVAIAEAQYAPSQEGAAPASTYKLGVWVHSGRFDDPALDRQGLPLADLRSSGDPRRHTGDYGIYATTDQLLYRAPDSQDLGLGAFLRVAAAPGDRNLIAFYVDGGLVYKGLIAGRDDDLASLGVAYARIGGQARRYDDEVRRLGLVSAARDREMAVELTYQLAVAPWWSIQPDLQWISHPTSQDLQPASGSTMRRGDVVVGGLRTSVRF